MEIQHVPGKHNVADYLSRIPGMETLDLDHLCSTLYTMNLSNMCDFIDTNGPKTVDINSIITIFDKSSFLSSIFKS
jgi:hypothetical protein